MKFKTIFWIIFIAGMLDLCSTIIGIEMGVLYEANPVGKFILSLGYDWAFIITSFVFVFVSLVIFTMGKVVEKPYPKLKGFSQLILILVMIIPRIYFSSKAVYWIIGGW